MRATPSFRGGGGAGRHRARRRGGVVVGSAARSGLCTSDISWSCHPSKHRVPLLERGYAVGESAGHGTRSFKPRSSHWACVLPGVRRTIFVVEPPAARHCRSKVKDGNKKGTDD